MRSGSGRKLTHSRLASALRGRNLTLSTDQCSCIVPGMAKPKSRYTCQACGSVQHRWQGQCPDCAEWNTLVQESAEVSSIFAAKHNLQGGGRVIPLVGLETPAALPERLPSGIAEFDRAIGSGIVPGSAMLVGGDPGIGKSTLLLQVAARLASEGHSVVYVSGEESAEQVRLRAVRL